MVDEVEVTTLLDFLGIRGIPKGSRTVDARVPTKGEAFKSAGLECEEIERAEIKHSAIEGAVCAAGAVLAFLSDLFI